MGRSAESIDRRKAARREWATSAEGRAYLAEWRRKHAAGERDRCLRWKAAHPDKVRAQQVAWNEARRERRALEAALPEPALPEPASGHALFDAAARLVRFVGRGRSVSFWEEELEYDLRAEAVLAMLEGRDPAEAVRAYRGRERNWHAHAGWAGPLLTGEFAEELAA